MIIWPDVKKDTTKKATYCKAMTTPSELSYESSE